MATLINNAGVQHYANKMVLAENRKVGSKSLPTALADIDNLIDEMKTQFDAEYGSALDMKLENNENVFSVGTGTNVDKSSEVENSFTDVELSGNSVVNLADEWEDVTNETISFYYGAERSICKTSKLKNNTYYTLIANYKINLNNTTAYDIMQLGLSNYKNSVASHPSKGETNYSFNVKDGLNVIKFHFSDYKHDEYAYFNIRPIRRGTEPVEGESVTFSCSDLILLEGDWTNKPIPQYFEGLKSVGEKEDGNHKIEILSQNENLFDNTKAFQGYVTSDGQLTNRTHNNIRSDYISIKPNTYYSVLCDGASGAHNYSWFDSNKVFIQRDTVGNKCISPSNAHYLIYHNAYVNDNSYVDLDSAKITLTIGQQVPTQHIVHKSNKKEILLNEPLRGLPNGIKDTIEKINGEWKIVRRCHETILDGSEDWRSGGYTNTDRQELYLSPDKLIPSTNKRGVSGMSYNNYISNNFPTIQGNIATSNSWLAINGIGGLTLALPKDELAEPYFASAKQWLSQNPTKVVYELETPIIENISPVTLQCWKNGTISIDEVLPVETTHTVALNKPAQIKRNIEELTVLRKRVQALEDFYDQVALEQSHQLSLISNSIELDYDI